MNYLEIAADERLEFHDKVRFIASHVIRCQSKADEDAAAAARKKTK